MDMSSSMTTAASVAAATASAMPMEMGGDDNCKITMLWNWYTIDACFISSVWHINSEGMFAGSCIGVILLVMTLEFLRRAVKEYDRFLVTKHNRGVVVIKDGDMSPSVTGFRPTLFQQAIRAFLHMVQFAVAYLIMLLAMFFNGWIIISIFIGAYLGAFIFQWELMGVSKSDSTSAVSEATVCCG